MIFIRPQSAEHFHKVQIKRGWLIQYSASAPVTQRKGDAGQTIA